MTRYYSYTNWWKKRKDLYKKKKDKYKKDKYKLKVRRCVLNRKNPS